MKKITVKYSEDFRKNRVASRIYDLIRDKGLDPIIVNVNYQVSIGVEKADYIFKDGTILPEKSKLEKMLKGIKFTSVEIFNLEEVTE